MDFFFATIARDDPINTWDFVGLERNGLAAGKEQDNEDRRETAETLSPKRAHFLLLFFLDERADLIRAFTRSR
jgi:hypothetical protein